MQYFYFHVMKVFLLLYGGWVLARIYTGYFSSMVIEGAKTKLVCFFFNYALGATKKQKGVERG